MHNKELIEQLVPLPKTKRKVGRPAKHGVYSKGGLLPLANEKAKLIIDVLEGEEQLIKDQDMILVRILGRCLARMEMIDRYIEEHGIISDEVRGTPQPIYQIYLREQAQAVQMLDRLGLTPQARIRLGHGLGEGFDIAKGIQEIRD